MEASPDFMPNVSYLELANAIAASINNWLNSSEFRPLEKKLRTELQPGDEIRAIVQAEDALARRLPWHLWEFFDNFRKAEVAVGSPNYQQAAKSVRRSENARILAVLGDSRGIDIQKDRQFLQRLPGAEVEFLVEPKRPELNEYLWDSQGWDIFFFAGHSISQPDGATGEFLLNPRESLTIPELRYAMRTAIEQGLQLAIFNSCDGLGIARDLADLQIPQMIFMREPVPDLVAQTFLKDFLTAFSRGTPLYLSVREAREKLQGLESQHPCASWLPVICQNSAEVPPTWTKLGGVQGLVNQKVFISYCDGEPERSLGNEFAGALREAGHEAFRAEESIGLGENWPQRVEQELQECDYLLLLLSERSATSEVTTKEIERAKELRESRPGGKPAILPIRVNFLPSSSLNYEQRGYLDKIGQGQWNGDEDTPAVLAEILRAVATGEMPNREAASQTDEPASRANPDSAPLPVAEPELPEGQMELASRFYVERPPIESSCYQTILNPGSLIRIKAPRQMGKTSLLARIIQRAELQGYRTVSLNLQLTDRQILSRLDKFLKWLCASASQKLNLPQKLEDYWSGILGDNTSCTTYFERYLLANTDSPIVLALDEVDRVFQYREVADDFFALLRAWHEDAKNNAIWKKLRLAIAHSTEVYIPLNINQSPFNVGLGIELPEFRSEQVEDLARRHGLSWGQSGQSQVEQLMHLLGGHPFLVRVALYYIARQDITLEALLKNAATDASLYGDHLRRHWWNLQQNPELAEAFYRVVSASKPVRLEPLQGFKLNSMGLVNLQNDGVTPRCDLYRQYFQGIAV